MHLSTLNRYKYRTVPCGRGEMTTPYPFLDLKIDVYSYCVKMSQTLWFLAECRTTWSGAQVGNVTRLLEMHIYGDLAGLGECYTYRCTSLEYLNTLPSHKLSFVDISVRHDRGS